MNLFLDPTWSQLAVPPNTAFEWLSWSCSSFIKLGVHEVVPDVERLACKPASSSAECAPHEEVEFAELCPHNSGPGKQLLQDIILLGLRRTDSFVTVAWVWEDSWWWAVPSLGVKECNARDGEERGVVCCRCKAKRSSIALVYSERRAGSESHVQISAPVLQASSLWLSPWGLKRFLFRSPHHAGRRCTPHYPPAQHTAWSSKRCRPHRWKAAAGTVCSYVLIPCVVPSDTLPKPRVGRCLKRSVNMS